MVVHNWLTRDADPSTFQPGDVVRGSFSAGVKKIKISETPHWSDYHERWYVAGYKWIESRQVFSGSHLIWNAPSLEKVS